MTTGRTILLAPPACLQVVDGENFNLSCSYLKNCSDIYCDWRRSFGDFEGSRCQIRQCTCKIRLCIFNSDHQKRRRIWNDNALFGGHCWYKWIENSPWRMWDRTKWNSELWQNTSYPSINALPNFTTEKRKFLQKLSVWTSETQRASVTYVNVQTTFSAYRLDLEDRDTSSNRKMSCSLTSHASLPPY